MADRQHFHPRIDVGGRRGREDFEIAWRPIMLPACAWPTARIILRRSPVLSWNARAALGRGLEDRHERNCKEDEDLSDLCLGGGRDWAGQVRRNAFRCK